jgi:hypothetical protein
MSDQNTDVSAKNPLQGVYINFKITDLFLLNLIEFVPDILTTSLLSEVSFRYTRQRNLRDIICSQSVNTTYVYKLQATKKQKIKY